MYARQLVVLALALATSTMANPVPRVDNAEDLEDTEVRDVFQKSTAAKTPGCTTVIPILPAWTWGPTRTIWTTTTTATAHVDCGLCTAIARTYLNLGVPPVVIFNDTTTVAVPSTTTVLRCATTTSIATATPASAVSKLPVSTPTPKAV
ncbi:hypothetical protein VFPPC_07140 [Pochonia chlamydosporia 170]|uniref:Uncharacterized protein n=1 Tax=Pochonia chlamydosporia 170 TaxID=1380566 RepID=A0A179F9X5_METCM|nr:hypothetical protein VFPPC_07140 [Pochonia chlamydosporia 170]OAQ62207.1 hypothetical protein VFPPC_07140 [Pochonia chlamydosporia 170]